MTKKVVREIQEEVEMEVRTEKWFDCGGIGILAYAVTSNEENVVEELAQSSEARFQRRRVHTTS